MAKGSAKKPGEAKCRGSATPIEGRDWVRVGGSKWLREVAEQKGKFIPLEYRNGRPSTKAEKAEKAEEAARAAKAAKAAKFEAAEAGAEEQTPEEAVAE